MKNGSEKTNPVGPFHSIIDEGFTGIEEIGRGVYAAIGILLLTLSNCFYMITLL